MQNSTLFPSKMFMPWIDQRMAIPTPITGRNAKPKSCSFWVGDIHIFCNLHFQLCSHSAPESFSLMLRMKWPNDALTLPLTAKKNKRQKQSKEKKSAKGRKKKKRKSTTFEPSLLFTGVSLYESLTTPCFPKLSAPPP